MTGYRSLPLPHLSPLRAAEEKIARVEGEEFEFNFLPRDIKAHLDRFVIKQEEAKKVLAIAVCDHYNHAKYLRSSKRKMRTARKKSNTPNRT